MENIDFNLKAYAPVLATAYGEGANQDTNGKVEILSTILNRAESGRAEFGADSGKITDVLNRGYYAYSQKSPKFMEAINQKFPDEMSKKSYREYEVLLSGMLSGKVGRTKSLFFLTPNEVQKVKKTKAINMDLLEETGKNKTWIFYKYKDKLAGKRKTSKKE